MTPGSRLSISRRNSVCGSNGGKHKLAKPSVSRHHGERRLERLLVLLQTLA
jgi:hypothetical protein